MLYQNHAKIHSFPTIYDMIAFKANLGGTEAPLLQKSYQISSFYMKWNQIAYIPKQIIPNFS